MRIINVTQEDIDKGLVGDDKECGIARALKRQLGSALSSDLDKELAARVAEGVCVPGARANTFTLGGHNYYLPKKGQRLHKQVRRGQDYC